jgi:hypothetical protein
MSAERDGQEYYYQLLLLHLPYEEEKELRPAGVKPEDLFRQKRKDLEERLAKFSGGPHKTFLEALERALAEMDEFDRQSAEKHVVEADVTRPEADQLAAAIEKPDVAPADAGVASTVEPPVQHREDAPVEDEPVANAQDPLYKEVLDEALSGYRMRDEEFDKMMAELNPGQRYVVDWLHHVYDVRRQFALGNAECTYPPFCLFVSGEGGTGKTFLLKVMREKIERMTQTTAGSRRSRVEVGAPTGIAASHIPAAGTFHLKLAVRPGAPREGLRSTATGADLSLLKDKIRNLRAFFFDEVSMIGDASFDQINARCCELRGNKEAAFGGLYAIFFGGL